MKIIFETKNNYRFYIVGLIFFSFFTFYSCGKKTTDTAAVPVSTAVNNLGAWQWTKQLGVAYTSTKGTAMTTDTSGNVYVAGHTEVNLPSCSGVSSSCSGSAGQGSQDYFISKYNSSGVWQWTQQLGETAKSTMPYGLVVDTSGSIYITGATTGNLVSCNGVSASCSGNAQGTTDYFISKYNLSGAWLWTKQLGESAKNTYSSGLSQDSNGNLYVAGYSDGNISSCNGVSATCTGSSQGTSDYFISKYNSSGVWQWTQQLGETAKNSISAGIASDSSDNLYISGYTTGNLASCSGVSATCSGSSQGTNDNYISKYNSSGAWQWTSQLGETAKSAASMGIAVDLSGNVFITGETTGNLLSCNGVSASCTGSSQGVSDYYVSKYNTSGVWQWTKQLGETAKYNTSNSGIAADSSGNVYISGETSGNLVSCNGTSASCSGVSQGSSDYHVSKYNSSGTWQWTKQLGAEGTRR